MPFVICYMGGSGSFCVFGFFIVVALIHGEGEAQRNMVVGGLQQQKHPPRPRMMEMHNGSEQCACMFRSTRTPFMEMVAVLR